MDSFTGPFGVPSHAHTRPKVPEKMKTSDLKGKKAVVVGLGISGKAAVKFLHKYGAQVIANDCQTKNDLGWGLDPIKNLEGLQFELGRHPSKIFQEADLVVVSPGIPWDLKQLQTNYHRSRVYVYVCSSLNILSIG